MRTVVVYESMYGNTHEVADAIADGLGADGLGADGAVVVVAVERAERDLLETADLVVVGGPTHAHGMSRSSTREAAAAAARKPDSELELDPDAEGPGLREWFAGLERIDAPVAAFDTRVDAPAVLTGRASKGIARRLRRLGATLIVEPESFLVTKANHLEADEEQRARAWGAELARAVSRVERRPGSRTGTG